MTGAQRRLRSAWASAQSDQSLLCAQWVTKDPSFLHVDSFCLCWGLTSQSTIFQSCRDGATTSWVINQYFRGAKCLAQGHNTAAVGFEPRTSRSGVWHSTTEPPRSPMWTVKTLIRLGGYPGWSECPGWSESLLGAHAILLVLSWGGSYLYLKEFMPKANNLELFMVHPIQVPYIVPVALVILSLAPVGHHWRYSSLQVLSP